MNKVILHKSKIISNFEEGDIFQSEAEYPYILTQVSANQYSLINLATGNRARESKKNISEAVYGYHFVGRNMTIEIKP